MPGWFSQLRPASPTVQPGVEVVNSPRVPTLVRAPRAQIGFVEDNDELRGFASGRPTALPPASGAGW